MVEKTLAQVYTLTISHTHSCTGPALWSYGGDKDDGRVQGGGWLLHDKEQEPS